MKYPKTVAAVQKAEGKSQWAIGDALLVEIGPPTRSGGYDASGKRFEECAKELNEHGLTYKPETLRRFRDTAHAFISGARAPEISYRAHESAGNLRVLGIAIERAAGRPVSHRFVDTVKASLREAEKAKQEKKAAAAKERAEKAKASGDEEAVAKAEEAHKKAEREAARPPEPKPAPKEEVDAASERLEIINRALKAKALAREVAARLERIDFSTEDRERINGYILEAVNAWQELRMDASPRLEVVSA